MELIMRKLFSTLFLLGAFVGNANATTINGAGASFPYPIYAKWAQMYQEATGNKLNYQSIGSGGGIKQIKAGTVDFGASDAPMKQSELDEYGLVQFPVIIGTVVTPINLPGVDVSKMYLDIETISDIYLGKIRKWNDERIQKLNPDLKLPDTTIAVIHRSDGSGTTFLFASNLSQSWKDEVGVGKALKWPVGVGGKGNHGVAAGIKQYPGSIGYLNYGYVNGDKFQQVALQNKAGNFVKANSETSAAGLAKIVLDDKLRGADPNPAGANAYPIVSLTWILAYPESAPGVKETLRYMLSEKSQGISDSLGYVPLPESLRQKSLAAVDSIK